MRGGWDCGPPSPLSCSPACCSYGDHRRLEQPRPGPVTARLGPTPRMDSQVANERVYDTPSGPISRPGPSGPDSVWPGLTLPGMAQPCRGPAWPGLARPGPSKHVDYLKWPTKGVGHTNCFAQTSDSARPVWQDSVWPGPTLPGMAQPCRGPAWPGVARPGPSKHFHSLKWPTTRTVLLRRQMLSGSLRFQTCGPEHMPKSSCTSVNDWPSGLASSGLALPIAAWLIPSRRWLGSAKLGSASRTPATVK